MTSTGTSDARIEHDYSLLIGGEALPTGGAEHEEHKTIDEY